MLRKGFLIRKEVCKTLHRNAKSLSKNIIPCRGSFLSTFDFLVIGIVRNGFAKVRVCFKPSRRVSYFFNAIELIIPNRNMWSVIITLKDVHKFHFDSIASTITNSTFRTHSDDHVVIKLGCTLLDSTNNILSNVARKPFVNRRHLRSETLKFIGRHRSDFENGTCKEVIDTLLCRGKFDAIRVRARGILEGALGEELEERTTGSSNSGTERGHDRVSLSHCRRRCELMSWMRFIAQQERLDTFIIHTLWSYTLQEY